jgi:hypothetical protein
MYKVGNGFLLNQDIDFPTSHKTNIMARRNTKIEIRHIGTMDEDYPYQVWFEDCEDYVFLSEDELRDMTLNFEKVLKKHHVAYQMNYFKKREGRKLGHMFSILHPEYEESAELIDNILDFFKSNV